MKKTIVCLLFLLLLLPVIAVADNLRVTYIDVGQGDAALVQCGGQSMLIDTGTVESREALLSFLDQAEIIALDYVVGTHPEDDHIGGIPAVLSRYDVQAIWMPRVKNETKAFDEALLAIRQAGHLIDPPVVGNVFSLGDAVVTILAPISEVYENLDDYSIVIRIDHGRNSFLFCGDADQVSIDEMLASRANINANVLKVNNHGASVSNESAFLSAISPSIAVISCGAGNPPSDSTLDALERTGAMVLRTDESGNIKIESDRTTLFYGEQPALGEDEWYGRINTKNVNVRKGASKKEDRIAYFDEGSAVRVLLSIENDAGETWYFVEMNGLQGYVRSDFIDPVNPLAHDTDNAEETPRDDELDEYFMPKSSSAATAPPTIAPVGEETAYSAPGASPSPAPTIPLSIMSTANPPAMSQGTPEAAERTPEATEQAAEAQFIGNIISMIFHKATCDSLPSQKNRVPFATRNEAVQAGYLPCMACKP